MASEDGVRETERGQGEPDEVRLPSAPVVPEPYEVIEVEVTDTRTGTAPRVYFRERGLAKAEAPEQCIWSIEKVGRNGHPRWRLIRQAPLRAGAMPHGDAEGQYFLSLGDAVMGMVHRMGLELVVEMPTCEAAGSAPVEVWIVGEG
jgi:hypothetical protein